MAPEAPAEDASVEPEAVEAVTEAETAAPAEDATKKSDEAPAAGA